MKVHWHLTPCQRQLAASVFASRFARSPSLPVSVAALYALQDACVAVRTLRAGAFGAEDEGPTLANVEVSREEVEAMADELLGKTEATRSGAQ